MLLMRGEPHILSPYIIQHHNTTTRIMSNKKAQTISTKLEAELTNIKRLLVKNNVSIDSNELSRDERINNALLSLQASVMKSQALLASK